MASRSSGRPHPPPEWFRGRGRPASARTSPEPRRTFARSGRTKCTDRDRNARTGARHRPCRRSGRRAREPLCPMPRRHGLAHSARAAIQEPGPAATTPAAPASRAPQRLPLDDQCAAPCPRLRVWYTPRRHDHRRPPLGRSDRNHRVRSASPSRGLEHLLQPRAQPPTRRSRLPPQLRARRQ
jgi:hypothetical protein